MAFNLFGGKRRITKGFFANSLGNKQTRGIYTFQIDVENGELIFKKYFVTPTDPVYAFNYGRFSCITYRNRTGSVDDGGICSYAELRKEEERRYTYEAEFSFSKEQIGRAHV